MKKSAAFGNESARFALADQDEKKLNDLEKYRKTREKIKYTSTSVSIRDDQAEFIRRNDLNFSELIRDYLDRLIDDSKKQDDDTEGGL